MKTIVLTIIYLTICLNLKAQTYFSPLLGFDLTKLENKYDGGADDYLVILEKGYKIESLSLGYKLKHRILKNIFISLVSKYSHNNVKADRVDIVTVKGIKYNYFHNHLSICYSFGDFYLGSGLSYNFIGNLKYSIQTSGDKYQVNEKGIIILLGKEISNFEFELYYYKGLSSIDINKFDLYLKPINSFGLSLSYPIKIANNASKDPNCPKF